MGALLDVLDRLLKFHHGGFPPAREHASDPAEDVMVALPSETDGAPDPTRIENTRESRLLEQPRQSDVY